jgi:hypothetical protein
MTGLQVLFIPLPAVWLWEIAELNFRRVAVDFAIRRNAGGFVPGGTAWGSPAARGASWVHSIVR